MRIAIATDAWCPQPNGVVRVVGTVIGTVVDRLQRLGHEALVVSPDLRPLLPRPDSADAPIGAASPFDKLRVRG